MTSLTVNDLMNVKRRCEAATPGPWHRHRVSLRTYEGTFDGVMLCETPGGDAAIARLSSAWRAEYYQNAIFLCQSQPDVEALLAEVMHLRSMVKAPAILARVRRRVHCCQCLACECIKKIPRSHRYCEVCEGGRCRDKREAAIAARLRD